MQRNRLAVLVLGGLVLLTLARVWFAAGIELLPEEAYYWTYAQHPALSYFDHPPMVAWVITAGTVVFGHTELGVRIGMISLSLASSWLLFLLVRSWVDARRAWVAVLIFNLLPVFATTGFLAFPDGPLLFFWLLTMTALTRALGVGESARLLEGDGPRARRDTLWWLLAGVGFGGAMLSKYTAVMLAPSLLVFLALSPTHRHWLRRPQPWLAAAVAAAAFGIVVIWNAQHGWASFLFQTGRTSEGNPGTLVDIPLFWVYQLAVLTPVGFALAAWALAAGIWRGWWRREEPWNFVASFAAPLFLLFVWASTKTQVHINWTAPAYLSLTMGGAVLACGLVEQPDRRRARRWQWLGGFSAALALVVLVGGLTMLRWGVPAVFTYTHAGGWRELARQIELTEAALQKETGQEPFILGADKYYLSAELSFYSHEPQEQLNLSALGLQGLAFKYWTRLEDWESHPAVVVLPKLKKSLLLEVQAHFDRVSDPRELSVKSIGNRQRTVYVMNAYGYHHDHNRSQAGQDTTDRSLLTDSR